MPKKILALVDDLFFSTKISSTAQSYNIPIELVKSKDNLLEQMNKEAPGLIIVDLNGASTQPLETIQALKSDPRFTSAPVLAFFSHVQTELKEKAFRAGCDSVLPRSAFSQNLVQILRAHSQ
jgi:CheY-like chemotaxis protein